MPTDPIRVLHVTTTIGNCGGIQEFLRILCDRLDPAAFRIGICSICEVAEDIPKPLWNANVKLYFGGRQGYVFDVCTMLWIRRVISDFQADIVHTHNNKGNFHGRIAAALSRRAAIVTTHHDMADGARSKSRNKSTDDGFDPADARERNRLTPMASVVYPFLNVELNRLNAKVIGVSNAVRSVYTADPNDARFVMVYAPFDERIFNSEFGGFREKSTIVLGTVGRLSREKGQIYLLMAFQQLLQIHPHLRLRIVGTGPLRPELESYVADHQLGAYVTFAGALPHNADLYRDMDIYVQPSLAEGCSITLLEAMGLGIPVIASDIQGPKELIVPEKTGILVPAKDPTALRDAVIRLLADQDRAVALGAAGRQRALANFAGSVFADKMSSIYRDVAQRRAVR